jgi:hypothetical protein
MATIVVSINGIGRTKQISDADFSTRVLPTLHFYNANVEPITYPAGTTPTVTTEGEEEPPPPPPPVVNQPATDAAVIERWADKIIADLVSSVEAYEDMQRVKSPLTMT